MSIQERAQQIIALADRAPTEEVQLVMSRLEEWGREVYGLLGETSSAMVIRGCVQQAVNTGQQLLEAVEIMKQAARETGQQHLNG